MSVKRPITSFTKKSSKANATATKSSNEKNTGFETIYLTSDIPPKKTCDMTRLFADTNANVIQKVPPIRCYERKPQIKANDTFSKVNEVVASRNNIAGFERVKITLTEPPKRTYSHGAPAKPPQLLDISMTCYCRCHNAIEEERKQSEKTIEAMKKKDAEQSQQIELLLSQNKISEHLLKTKMNRIADLVNAEQSLRKEVESLSAVISEMGSRQIRAAKNASNDSITLARMICDKRRNYRKSEVLLAQKIYSASAHCYNFMREVLKFNLPHTTTLKRQRELNAADYEAQQQHKDHDDLEITMILEKQSHAEKSEKRRHKIVNYKAKQHQEAEQFFADNLNLEMDDVDIKPIIEEHDRQFCADNLNLEMDDVDIKPIIEEHDYSGNK